MTLRLQVRPMAPGELPMVLSDWKKELFHQRASFGWGKGLQDRDYWALVNYVLDRITVPSCDVYVGVHENHPDTPCCWAATRDDSTVYIYARQRISHEPELAAALQRALLGQLQSPPPRPFNPFLELRR